MVKQRYYLQNIEVQELNPEVDLLRQSKIRLNAYDFKDENAESNTETNLSRHNLILWIIGVLIGREINTNIINYIKSE